MSSTEPSWDRLIRPDGARLWAGGAVTALVAAGVALVGVLALYKLLDTTVVSPGGRLTFDDSKVMLPVAAAVATLCATGLLHLLMATTPRAPHFFSWIAGLVMALLILQVFVSGTSLLDKVEAAAFYLVIGVVITSSLFGVGRTAVRYRREAGHRYADEAPRRYSDDATRRYDHPDDGAYGHEPRRYR